MAAAQSAEVRECSGNRRRQTWPAVADILAMAIGYSLQVPSQPIESIFDWPITRVLR